MREEPARDVSMRDEFLGVMAESMHCPRDIFKTPGVTVAADPGRSENKVTAGYVLGDHFIVSCDPAVEQRLTDAMSTMEPTFDAWHEHALAAGGEFLGNARMQLLPSPEVGVPALASGFALCQLDRNNASDVALIQALVDASSEDDLDEAEVEMHNLDPTIFVAVDNAGAIAAFAAARPFDMAPAFYDIGVITRADCRGKGLGKIVVAVLSNALIEQGVEPLYRCDEDNAASVGLSASLGFTPATKVSGYRFPS